MVLYIYGKTGSGMQVLGALHPALVVGAATLVVMLVAPCTGQGRVAMVMPFKLWVPEELLKLLTPGPLRSCSCVILFTLHLLFLQISNLL